MNIKTYLTTGMLNDCYTWNKTTCAEEDSATPQTVQKCLIA